MGKPMIRLDRDVAKWVQKKALKNASTLPKQVNHLLRILANEETVKVPNPK